MKTNILLGNLFMDIGQAMVFSYGILRYMQEDYTGTALGFTFFLLMSLFRSYSDSKLSEVEK